MRKLVDPTFGIKQCSLEVAKLLADLECPQDWMTTTSPWYNGRERGIVFCGGPFSGPVLCIAVFEHRNSDAICALRWERKYIGMNPPTIDSDGELAYPTDNKWMLTHQEPFDGAAEMATWVRNEFKEYMTKAN